MGAFAYQAIDAAGKQSTGSVEAPDAVSANRALRQRGLTVVGLREGAVKDTRADQLSKLDLSFLPWLGGGGVASRDLTLFSRQFATMVGAGLTILRCLIILEEQAVAPKLKAVIREVCSDIESGRSLSDALERHPKVFDRLYVSMVRAGEIGGVLEMTLQRVASQMEARESLKRKIKSAMTYPTVVLIFAVLAAIGMIIFLVPVFEKMYAGLGNAKLPAITVLLQNQSKSMKTPQGLLSVVLTLLAPYVAFKLWTGTDVGRSQWHRIALKIPMKIGVIVQKVALARFARTLSSLLAAGVPMMQAVQITGESAGNSVIEDATDDVIRSIEEGRSFTEPLRRHSVFPTMVVQMSAIGEETGKMDAMLEKVAEFYEDEVDALVKSLTSIIEPIMMILVGAIVGFIIIALYLPMFDLFKQIH